MPPEHVTAFPLCWPAGWPRARYRNRSYRFKNNTFARARDSLGLELDRLGTRDCILSTNVPLRLDGQPKGGFSDVLADPGVAVYFTLRGKTLVMARDEFDRVSDNLRSLALAINYLRGLERHGGATMLERAFTGFAALPAPSLDIWRRVLRFNDDERPTVADIEARFRTLAKERHPDLAGGSTEQMAALNQARDDALRAIGA